MEPSYDYAVLYSSSSAEQEQGQKHADNKDIRMMSLTLFWYLNF